MKMRRWDVRWRVGYLTDDSGRYGLFWTKRAAFRQAAWVNETAQRHGSRSRCYIIDRRTGERYETQLQETT